ncbi:MAG: AraC family transcriptional regulator [Clostridiales bacterium]|nr:AraC family transcriptional regulator [Clostridiales bacterium]
MIRIEASVYNHYENTQQHTCCLDFEEITLYQLQNGLEFRRRFLNQFTLLYIEKGAFDIYVESKLLHLEEKSLLLIPPYQFIHGASGQTDVSQACVLYMLEFRCDHFDFFSLDKYLLLPSAEPVEALLAELYNEHKTLEHNTCFHDAWLLLIIRMIKKLMTGHKEQQLAEKVRAYILRHTMQPITITEISSELKYNKDYLCRIFKKEYGCSIKEYINKEKISLSKRLLQMSDLPVTAISHMLGWEDVNLFFKYFKYHEKITPTQYRTNTVH